MNNEIIYVCNSVNNKNVRANELEILRKYDDKLYFEFGESEDNIKKRFYNDVKTLNKDFDALMKLKNKETADELIEKSKEKDLIEPVEKAFIQEEKEEKEPVKKSFRKYNKKSNLFN